MPTPYKRTLLQRILSKFTTGENRIYYNLITFLAVSTILVILYRITPSFSPSPHQSLHFPSQQSSDSAYQSPLLHQRQCNDNDIKYVDRLQLPREALSWDALEAKFTRNRTSVLSSTSSTLTERSADLGQQLGLWSPIDCEPDQAVAIIIPYRNRDLHLRLFLQHMHAFLRHQKRLYMIFVVEQTGITTFNRAALFNVGFREAVKLFDFDCFIFHDVDLLPENDRMPYKCGPQPIHFSVSVNHFGYKLMYQTLFGGVVALTRHQFTTVRGFPNLYYGWGGEDDDMSLRVRSANFNIFRHPPDVARFTMHHHTRDARNEENEGRFKLLKEAASRFKSDGYPETNYTLISAYPRRRGLVFWISVDLPVPPPPMQGKKKDGSN